VEREGISDRPAAGEEALGSDEQEFSSVEDVGNEPAENPQIDDV
jgi:hypothetical protein